MKKTAKSRTEVKKSEPKKSEKVIIPPDVIDEEKEHEIDAGKEAVPLTASKTPIEQNAEEKSSDMVEVVPIAKSEEKSIEKIEEKPADVPEKVEENETAPQEATFYEKVTGEKPPEKSIIDSNQDVRSNAINGNDEGDIPPLEKNNRKLFFLGGVVFLLTVVITLAAGFFILNSSKDSKKESENQKEIESVVQPTKAPEVELDRKEWTFEVLNGSGKAGEASKASDKLESLGYEVVNIGNADENVTTTEVYVDKEMSSDKAKLVLEDLEKDFGLLKVTGDLEDSDANIRIILGEE